MCARPATCGHLAILASVALLILAGCARLETQRSNLPSATNEYPALGAEDDIATEERIAALSHFAHGMLLELNQQPNEAVDAFAESLVKDPGNVELALDVSRRLLAAGEKEEALEVLKRSAAQTNASVHVFSWLAVAHLQNGQTNEAIQANKLAIKTNPQSFPPYQNLAQIYLQTGRTNEALNVLKQAASTKNTEAEFNMALADMFLRFGRESVISEKEADAAVRKLLESTFKLDSENPLVLSRMADLFLAMGDTQKGAESMEKLVAAFPNAPGVKEKLANLYLRENNKEKAQEYFQMILEERPTDPMSHYMLGSLAFEGRDLVKAEEHFETAMRLNPEFEPLYYDLAGAKIALKKTDEALKLLERARAKFKMSFVMEYYTGVALASAEKYTEALSHFTSAELLAKSAEPSRLTHQFYFQVGAASERVGNFPDAAKAFRKVLEMDPENADAMNYLGYMWAERGENLEEAHDLIRKAVELEPENPAYIDSLAWALFQLKRPKEALEYMLKAVSLIKEPDATLLDHLGDIYAALNESQKAQEAWEKSLGIEPNEKIRSKLEKVRAATAP